MACCWSVSVLGPVKGTVVFGPRPAQRSEHGAHSERATVPDTSRDSLACTPAPQRCLSSEKLNPRRRWRRRLPRWRGLPQWRTSTTWRMCWEREYPYIPSTTYSIYYILNTHQYLHYWNMSILYILHLGVHILYTHIPCIVCTIWLHWIAGARHGSVSSPSSAHMAGFMADICFYVVRPT